jgi:hypothetical protein
MQEEKPQRVEKSVDETLTERFESRSTGKQQEQASNEIFDGSLNEQKMAVKAEIQRTGKSKITGVKGAEGGPGFPSAESVFGKADEQTSLRNDWQSDARKTELINEIRQANAQGKLIADGGFREAPNPHQEQEKADRQEIAASVRSKDFSNIMDKVYGTNHLVIPARPAPEATHAKPNQSIAKPEPGGDENKEPKPKPGDQIISAGGPGPPGDNDNYKRRYWDFDPEYETGENFATKHRIDPKSPPKGERSEPDEKTEKKRDDDKDEEKDKSKLFSSGYEGAVYRIKGNDEYVSAIELAKILPGNHTSTSVDKLRKEELAKHGIERIAVEKADYQLGKRFLDAYSGRRWPPNPEQSGRSFRSKKVGVAE